ncbi:hypothetical protein [Paraburkholderia kirstenboschensis]|uniref:hypothetical protein n=1 Tax=Paraburkholderia kirstenboschensis TaxID=1245436 RepID=UPI000A7FAA26|nr:hypothetical protein [Paraburkholderia kirstenboschensis]
MAEDRDKRFHVSTAGQRRKRADIAERPVMNGANAWQSGTSVQLTLAEVQVKKPDHDQSPDSPFAAKINFSCNGIAARRRCLRR